MARKRSRGGLRVGPPRYFYFPWQEEDGRARRERELAREARQWDEDRIRRFEQDQRRQREPEYVRSVEIAESYSELGGPVSPEEAAAQREQAYRMLESDLLAALFEEGGRSQVLFLFPGVDLTHGKMTRQRYQDAIDYNLDLEHGRFLLRHCWLPRKLLEDWCTRHNLSIPRFKPSQQSRVRVSPEGAERSLEPPMPTSMLVPQPASKSAVNIVEQTEAPDPSKASNKGGRPPAVDWEALKEPIVKEINKHGYPERRNPPGWRGTKDVADFLEKTFPKEAEKVARRTTEDNVRKIIRELKAASTAKPVSR